MQPLSTLSSTADILFYSAINPAATSFELEHYFAIAEPSIIAVDTSQVATVERALSTLNMTCSPQVILIDDGSTIIDAARPSVGCSIQHGANAADLL